MSGIAGLGENLFLELYSPAQGGGGLRANAVSLETNLDGKRETLRSMVRDYMGVAGGSTTRMIDLTEHVDFQWLNQGFDPELSFLNNEILQYRIIKWSNGQQASGQCHIKTGPKMTTKDGAITDITISLEGDPSPFQ
jgi:hypothetical protein